LAVGLSNKLDSELHVVHVGEIPDAYVPAESEILDPEFYERMRKYAEREAKVKLEEEIGEIREMGSEVAGVHAGVGRPDAKIVRLAEEIGAGLVVVGSRGFGPLRRALMGSVSTSVVRHAHCSVLVVREYGGSKRDHLPGRILLAIDGSREAQLAARAAVEISGAAGSELHLTYAMQAERYVPHLGPEMWEGWQAGFERAKQHARSWLEGQAELMQGEGAKAAEGHLVLGRPDAAIVWLADEIEAGLVVVGSRGHGGMRALIGSVSDSVVHHADCPVLVVRDQEHAERQI